MLLLIEVLIVSVLILVLSALYIDEHRTRYQNIPVGRMTGYWNGKERRKDVRIDKILDIRYTIEERPRATGNSLTKNISRGGILVETSEKLLVESLLGLEINIPNHQKPIVADGKVVWVKESPAMDQSGKRVFNTGIKFVYMDPMERENLLQYIKWGR